MDSVVPNLSQFDLDSFTFTSDDVQDWSEVPGSHPGSPGSDAAMTGLVSIGMSFTDLLGDLQQMAKPIHLQSLPSTTTTTTTTASTPGPAIRTIPSTPPTPPPAQLPRSSTKRGSATAKTLSPRRRAGRTPASKIVAEEVEEDGTSPLPEYTGPLPDSYWRLKEWQIAAIAFKDFIKLMNKTKLSDKQVKEEKRRRRRIKNRYSARQCSERKKTKVLTTEDCNAELRSHVAEVSLVNESLRSQHMLLQERFIELQKSEAEVMREKIFLTAEVERLHKLLNLAEVTDYMAVSSNVMPDFAGAA